MIIDEEDVKINIINEDNLHSNLKLSEAEDLLSGYKDTCVNLKPKDMVMINGTTMYFSDDENKNLFYPHIYKTSEGSDKWILFMKDDNEGYALYKNPQTDKMQLAWYHRKLIKPLNDKDEKKLITCYQPKR